MSATRAEVCATACADAFRGDAERLISPMGPIPALGARLAKATFEPDLVLNDGEATLVQGVPPIGADRDGLTPEGWLPFRNIFDLVWWGRRHVMMGATQIDRFGNQNISCIGDWKQPKVQLLGARGAPGNTINHTTSYWVDSHSDRVFVPHVDFVSGVGYDRAGAMGAGGRFLEIRRVITNLAVMDFGGPDHAMQLVSVHPGVSVGEVLANTGFDLFYDENVPITREPTDDELRLLRDVLDPDGAALGTVRT